MREHFTLRMLCPPGSYFKCKQKYPKGRHLEEIQDGSALIGESVPFGRRSKYVC